MKSSFSSAISIAAPLKPGYESILSPPAQAFVAELAQVFGPRVDALLTARRALQARLDAGGKLDFLTTTTHIRNSDWHISPVPRDLQDRRVEITGPTDRKMVINALNSGANCYMADFEDANAPAWDNLVQGQINLYDAVRGRISHDDPKSGKHYSLNDEPATLLVRPRGWHLPEKHVRLHGRPVAGGLFDFGLFMFHNAHELIERGSGPYFYLPKLEHHAEAKLWNDVFAHAQRRLGIPQGTIKATVLIETLPAAFQMDEILYELRDHCAGLNCGRWDHIFSFIKRRRTDPRCVLPDRDQVGMTQPFMRNYTRLLIHTCHRRGAHAMGGMAAQIPIKNDPAANAQALEKVRADKLREVENGHDGTWVAHPALVPIAKAVFNEHMPWENQIERERDEVHITADDLLAVPTGTRTDEGLNHNIRVGILYLDAWLAGRGAVPLYNLMEDAATAEIARAQIWQWLHHGAEVSGQPLTANRLNEALARETEALEDRVGAKHADSWHFRTAQHLFRTLCFAKDFPEFLTLPAYEYLIEHEARRAA